MIIGVLDDQQRLIEYRTVDDDYKPNPREVPLPDGCDLPADGTYKWSGQQFIPLGHGFGKPSKPPVPDIYAIYLTMKAVRDGGPVPEEALLWMDWYEQTLKQQHEESVKRPKTGRRSK
ncbi:MAG: hypothetical protein AAF942_00020 [Pseudomonadota bacterium]